MNRDRDTQDETPSSYDFSKGVRGKYAERLGGPNATWVREMASRDAQRWIAESLRRFQLLEAAFVAYFALLHNQDTDEAGSAASEAIENPRSLAYASLLQDLSGESGAAPELVVQLIKLLNERNWLVHRSFHSTRFEGGPGQFVERVTESAEAAAAVESEFRRFLLKRCESLGIPLHEAQDRAQAVIEKWAAA